MTTLPLLILIVGFSFVFYSINSYQKQTVRNHAVGIQNNTYLKLNACIISVPPQSRTPEYVKSCYNNVESANNTTITRYGYGK